MCEDKCRKCIYGSGRTDYLCNYAGVTGQTRKAQPPEVCKYFRPKKKGEPPMLAVAARRETGYKIKERPKKYDWDRAKDLYDAGLKDGQIARELGCRIQAVYLWRKRVNRPPNAPAGGQRKSTNSKTGGTET